MAEQDLRNSSNVLAGTDAIGWPMVAHASGNGRVIADEINADWDANNMQYAGVAIWSGAAQMHVKLSLRDGGGADVTPPSWWAGGGGGGTVGDCPERPPWPYLPPSMSARVGARGILRGARARR
jgi:hypothetical protein